MEQINTLAYKALFEACKVAGKADEKVAKARTEQVGAYTGGMRAALLCSSQEEFEAVADLLADNCRRNTDGVAVALHAPKREKASKEGFKYKVPQSLSNLRSVIGKAFKHGVKLQAIDAETKQPQFEEIDGEQVPVLRSFRDVQNEVNTHAAAAREATLTGIDLVRKQIGDKLAMLTERVKKADATKLATIGEWLGELIAETNEKPAVSTTPVAAAAAQPAPISASEAAKPTKAQRKAARKARSTGDKLQEAA